MLPELAGAAASLDDGLLLARRTEWRGNEVLGQRMFVSDAGEYPLMDARLIVFDALPDATFETAANEARANG